MNQKELFQGKICQENARQAFDLDDLENANGLYFEAETHYRAAFPTPGDRVFFMQASVLRCLEELIERHPVLYYRYRNEAEKFFQEWTEDTIQERISQKRIDESLSFLLWRKTNFNSIGSNAFNSVNRCVERGDFIMARQLLNDFISELKYSEDPERDAIIAIAQSKQALLVAKEELAKRRGERDLWKVASAHMLSAKKSRLPANTSSRQIHKIAEYRAFFHSNALKYKAAYYLSKKVKAIDDTLNALEKAELSLHKAALYARVSAERREREELPRTHINFLEYSHATVYERLNLMRFMVKGLDHYYEMAVRGMKDALRIANRMSPDEQARMFPHRFYSIKDIGLEALFIQSARAFRNRQWSQCVALLKEWIDRCEHEYHWTWRYANILVRLLGASVLSDMSENGGRLSNAGHQHIRKLIEVSEQEPIGAAGRYFAREIQNIPTRSASTQFSEVDLDYLWPYFLLDSTADSYEPPRGIDPFETLPKKIAWGLSLPTPLSEKQLALIKLHFLSSVEALLGYLCDYDGQWSFPDKLIMNDPDIDTLLTICSQFKWAQESYGKVLLEQLTKALSTIRDLSSIEEFMSSYEGARVTLRRLINLFPLIVSVEEGLEDLDRDKYAVARPDWCIDKPGRDEIRVFVKTESLLPIKSGRYYLAPPWRKGNRLSYRVDPDDNYPLFPVRFIPRWEHWAREIEKEAYSLPGGIKYYHLERAIELAKQSVPEDREVPRPRVGAIIIKDGEVIAEAYRNEDGTGMHAEETAFDKCRKEDLSGATVITTLEPCVRGRRSSKSPCANLILQAKIGRVIIGMLDPNPIIRGTAEGLFRENMVSVDYFPAELRRVLEELNKEFIAEHSSGEFRTIRIYE